MNDNRVKSQNPRNACIPVDDRLYDPPKYEHKVVIYHHESANICRIVRASKKRNNPLSRLILPSYKHYENMLEIYCFDIGACIILITMLLTLIFRKMTRGRQNGIFLQLVSVALVSGIFDIISNVLNGVTTFPEPLKYAICGVFYVCRALGFFLYARYIIDLSATRHIFNKRWVRFIARPPVILAMILTVVTYFNHICYFYSSKGYFIRGRLNIIFYVICGGYALFAVCAIIKNHKFFGPIRSISLISVAGFSLVTAYIQYVYPYIVVDVLGFTTSLLFVMLFISNPEDKRDAVSGLKNYTTFIEDIKRAQEIEKPAYIIFMNVINLGALEEMISFDNFLLLARSIAVKIENVMNKYRLDTDLYYLRNGRYRVAIVENSESDRYIQEITETLLEELNCDIDINESNVTIETNVCLMRCPEDVATFEELYNFGGMFATESKKDYVMYASKLLESLEYDMITKLDDIMERAAHDREYELYYQPIYSVKEQKFTHAEALLRLFDPEFGLIDPEKIIAAAESNGSIHKIGKIVLEDVCRFIASDEFKELGLTAIAINVSLIQLMQKNYANDLISMLQTYGVRSDQIILEITESEVTENQKAVIDNIETIAKYGTKFSLNNYGTGYSNITTTSRLPLASSKLDRKLINSEHNDRLEVIIENSVKLLKSLNRTVVVVGVETEDMLDLYKELNVDYIQGYYFSRPLEKDSFVYFIKRSNNK